MGDLFGIGGIAQAGANAAAAGLNYDAQMDYNKKYLQGVQETNLTNMNMARAQNEWNKEERELVQKYNDPAAQVQRLRAAGLSAAAAAQAVGNIPSQPMQSADLSVAAAPQPMQAPQLDLSGLNIIGIARELEALKQSKIQTKDMELDYDFKPERLFTEQQIRNANFSLLRQSFEHNAQMFPHSLRAVKYGYQKDKELILNARVERKILQQNYKRAVKEFGWLDKFKTAELKKVFAEISNLYKEGKNLDQQHEIGELKKIWEKYGAPSDFVSRFAVLIGEGIITPESVDKNVQAFKEIGNYVAKGIGSFVGDLATSIMSGDLDPSQIDDDLREYLHKIERLRGRKVRKDKRKAAASGQGTPMGAYYEE